VAGPHDPGTADLFRCRADRGSLDRSATPTLRDVGARRIALTAIGGFLAVRNIVWFALLMLFLLPRALDVHRRRDTGERHVRLNLAILSLGALVVVALTVANRESLRDRVVTVLSAGALAAVRRAVAIHPRAPIWSASASADWILFDVPATRGRVVFDARFELLNRVAFVDISSFR